MGGTRVKSHTNGKLSRGYDMVDTVFRAPALKFPALFPDDTFEDEVLINRVSVRAPSPNIQPLGLDGAC
jgi:hypothetical protein